MYGKVWEKFTTNGEEFYNGSRTIRILLQRHIKKTF
jgi:hypothetical protein